MSVMKSSRKMTSREQTAYDLGFHEGQNAAIVHGRWERCFEDWRQQIEGDECSACGFQIYGGVSHFKYCPNCGAKMDGGNEDG